MPFSEKLADRVRGCLADETGVVELKMFGGWGVTLHGNMAVGVMGEDLIVRVGPEQFDAALARSGARPFDFTGRPMTGWVYVDGDAVKNARTLRAWVERGCAFATSLPPKAGGGARPRKRS